MAIDINQIIQGRIRSIARKQAHQQIEAFDKVVQAEIDRLGLGGEWFTAFEKLSMQVREAYEEKIVSERVRVIVDGMLNPAPQAPTCTCMSAELAASIARIDAHNMT